MIFSDCLSNISPAFRGFFFAIIKFNSSFDPEIPIQLNILRIGEATIITGKDQLARSETDQHSIVGDPIELKDRARSRQQGTQVVSLSPAIGMNF